MYRIVYLFILFSSVEASKCVQNVNTRIWYGEGVDYGEIPYQVFIKILEIFTENFSFNTLTCGGALISKQFVLTAAHCFYTNKGIVENAKISVLLGIPDLAEIPGKTGQIIKVEKWKPHEKFNLANMRNDIAILKLATPVKFNYMTRPIKLPSQNEPIPFNTAALTTGWGDTSHGATTMLQKLNVLLLDLETCKMLVQQISQNLYIGPEYICAIGERPSTIFKGDSGGPLVANDVLFGISSFTATPNSNHNLYLPAVYINVQYFLPWIYNNIKNM